MRDFVMSWDAHVEMAVLCHHPGSAGEGWVVCIAAFLPLSQESLGSLFLLTLVTPSCAGRILLERSPCRLLGRLE